MAALSKATLEAIQNRQRAGSNYETPEKILVEIENTGVSVSEIEYRNIEFFKPHPLNEQYDKYKKPSDFSNLKRAIKEAGRVLNPILALTDGTIIAGHSRVKICLELKAEGNPVDNGKIPVIFIIDNIDIQEQSKLMFLDNSTRFEMPEAFKIKMYSEIWPEWFFGERSVGGRPSDNPPTVGGLSEEETKNTTNESKVTTSKLEELTGKKASQLKNTRKIIQDAKELAEQEGAPEIRVEHVENAIEKKNKERREKSKKPVSASPASVSTSNDTEIPKPRAWDSSVQSTPKASENLHDDPIKALRKEFEMIAGINWENEQNVPDIEYVTWLEKEVIQSRTEIKPSKEGN